MNELPPHTGGLPVSPDSSSGVVKPNPHSEFMDKPVRIVDPGPGLIDGSSSKRKTVTREAGLRERGAEIYDSESNHRGSTVSEETASSEISDYEGQYDQRRKLIRDDGDDESGSEYSIDEEACLLGDNIHGPSMHFPVSAHSDSDRASTLTDLSGEPESAVTDQSFITIEGGGQAQNTNPDAVDEASITIEGGGQISKSTIKSVFKKVWNWAVDFARNHKIAVTLALVAVFCLAMSTPGGAAIVGALLSTALGGVGYVLASGLVGYVVVCFIGKTSLFADQVPPPANPPAKNPDTGQQQQNPPAQNPTLRGHQNIARSE